MSYQPPFALNSNVLELFGSIQEIIGQFKAKNILDVHPKLRRENQIKSVTASCAIEGNSLNESIVSDILDHKRVIGPAREILEVKNAIELYNLKEELNYQSIKDHLQAHKILMKGLIEEAGQFRKGGVGIRDGQKIIYVAPSANRVQQLMNDLFSWIKTDKIQNMVVKSALFHCEFETIHPFSDGNGRMGRFWQHLMLIQFHPIFRSVPVESMIHQHQQEYYTALQTSQKGGSCTPFVEFSLFTIVEALKKVLRTVDQKNTSNYRLKSFAQAFQGKTFVRSDYMNFFRGISTSTANRDLRIGVAQKLWKKSGDKRLTKYNILT